VAHSKKAEDVAARHVEVVTLFARGLSKAQIARKLQLDTGHVSRIIKDFRESNPTLRSVDPLDVIDQMLMGYQQDLEDLAAVAENAKNPTAVVGAINARMAARDRIIALLQSTGALPHDLGKLSIELDVRHIAVQLVAILERHGVPEPVQRELLTALRGGQLPAANGTEN
jgi:transcriptional regulator with XRE-family HTH domain